MIKNKDSKTSTSGRQQHVSKSMDVRMTSVNNYRQSNKGGRNGSNNDSRNNGEGDNHNDNEENNVFMREPITPTSIRQRFGQQGIMREGARVSPPRSPTAIESGEQQLNQYQQRLKKCDGIRSLSVNPSKTLLAVGLADPPVVMMYRLPDFTPIGITVRDHHDAVFSVQWLDDITFVTGSRDGSLGLWKCRNEDDGDINKEELQKVPRLWSSHSDGYAPRIRDTKLTGSATAASLAANGIVEIWDLNQRQKVLLLDNLSCFFFYLCI